MSAFAENFNIPAGDLSNALDLYATRTGVQLIYDDGAVHGIRTKGAHGDIPVDIALSRILSGTGFSLHRRPTGSIAIVRDDRAGDPETVRTAASTAPIAPGASLETVTVTSSKIGGDVQNIPISITALSQEQLTATQTAGGPDLVKQVPNLTFSKTNFTGYNIEIRGIGTQAISVTTDPAVAVAFNDIPFLRNHFFEQEFYDVSQVEVLRGPQGTLYGRNATAGVVNLVSAKPSDQFEAMASADLGNYQNRRLEGMINVPIVDDRLDLRIAGEWTKRQGYSVNELTDSRIDGRDLWSSRVTVGFKPTAQVQMYLVWEHFQENDDRLRSGKQLCKTDYGPGGTPTNGTVDIGGVIKPLGPGFSGAEAGDYFTQGCAPASLYSPASFEAPLGYTLPYILGLQYEGNANPINPYASETQSHNLRVIDSGINPTYRAKNDTLEFNADYAITPALTFTSQTGYNRDSLFSAEDYNRFGAAPGLFKYSGDGIHPQFNGVLPGGIVCDPQLGCSDRLMLEDLSDETAWQLSQEFRLASNFSGPLNFSAGANYLHYETDENYYVFGNVLTLLTGGYVPGLYDSNSIQPLPIGYQYDDPTKPAPTSSGAQGYIDPNPITHLNNEGHNYFLSQNPYLLNSYAVFGETYYQVLPDVKLTGGLRWTSDQKHFTDIPSWLIWSGWGYPVAGVENQQWNQLTGRAVANWTPKLDFTDQTLVYGSFAHGYKAGGANPPGAIYPQETTNGNMQGMSVHAIHPFTFNPEFIDAYELGTKNTLLDGALTLNGDAFFYNYTGYQISEIVDRTAINTNFNATVKGAELETSWQPLPGLKLNFAGGYESTRIDNGQSAVDLMDRTAGTPGWVLMKPWINTSSNCVFPVYVAQHILKGSPVTGVDTVSYCDEANILHLDPLTLLPYKANPTAFDPSGGMAPPGYAGYDPLAGTPGDPYTGQNTSNGVDYGPVPNGGAGFSKDLSGHQLPNAPHFTASFSAEYTMPLTTDWAGTIRGDYYWQDYSWARVFNDNPYDRIRGYTNVNLALILTSQTGWQVMGYMKNVFNVTTITGDFLNSDDSGLTTNVFLTDPRLVGVRVSKNW